MSVFTSQSEQQDLAAQRAELREIFSTPMSLSQRMSVIVEWAVDLTMTPVGRLVVCVAALSGAWFLI